MFKKILVLSIGGFALLNFGGCASMTSSGMQNINVSAVSHKLSVSAACILSNDKGIWVITAPAVATVHKSAADMKVICQNDETSGVVEMVSHANGKMYANVASGGYIGMYVDHHTGAGFDYDDQIAVQMTKTETKPKTVGIN